MKKLTILFFLIACCQIFSQNLPFIRIYDSNGNKINKGKILIANDTLLRIKKGKDSYDVSIKDIGSIKTKRSIGHNILIGSAIGATVFAGVGIASADPDAIAGYSADEGAAIGILLGAPAGAIVGAGSSVFKNSKTFMIDGDMEKWKIFAGYLSQK